MRGGECVEMRAVAEVVRHGTSTPRDLAGHACMGLLWSTERSPHPWDIERVGEVLRIALAGSQAAKGSPLRRPT